MVNTESFKRYVEVGRVALLNKGESAGQLAVIVEIIDHNRVSLLQCMRMQVEAEKERVVRGGSAATVAAGRSAAAEERRGRDSGQAERQVSARAGFTQRARGSSARSVSETVSSKGVRQLLGEHADAARTPWTARRLRTMRDARATKPNRTEGREQTDTARATAIIDNPAGGVARQAFQYRDLTLTPYVIKGLPRAAGSPAVKRAFEKAGVAEKWANSAWAKKRAALVARRELTDFGRFELRQAKAERRSVLGAAAKQVKA
ncbi:hypothetical protein OC834_002633 [Tilletia horrida]|nr:hypothetical protein OC834_002633 [Tilletia horrida]